MIESLTFYLFSIIAVCSSIGVVTVRNPVHSVLLLILTFFNTAGLFLLLGAEFIAILLIMVYVGAIAVLFLFVVMMLDINFVQIRQGFLKTLPIGIIITIILLCELIFIAISWKPSIKSQSLKFSKISNIEMIGNVLYTEYTYIFHYSGLILLVAMIGAIILTIRSRDGVKYQIISRQIQRNRTDTLTLKKIPSGRGI